MENGKRTPQMATLEKLSRALGIEPSLLVSGDPIGPETLTTAEAAAFLGVPYVRMFRWMKYGVLPGTKVCGTWHIPKAAVLELDRSGRLRGESRRLDG
jgi:excisionase family DNA binding protein